MVCLSKAANKLHIYFICNESFFYFIGFPTFGVKFVTDNTREFLKFESVRRDLVLLNQFLGRKCLFACALRTSCQKHITLSE